MSCLAVHWVEIPPSLTLPAEGREPETWRCAGAVHFAATRGSKSVDGSLREPKSALGASGLHSSAHILLGRSVDVECAYPIVTARSTHIDVVANHSAISGHFAASGVSSRVRHCFCSDC